MQINIYTPSKIYPTGEGLMIAPCHQVAGMLFYYIMTGGEHPCGRSPAEAQVNITRGWPKPREISIDVDSVLDTMLAFVPRARPSAEEVLR